MKQTIMWLALALLFAISATLSLTAGAFRSAATVETTETTERAAAPEAPQPVVATASATPALPEVPVQPLDDVPPLKPTIGAELLARWTVEPSSPSVARVAEPTAAPSPPASATTATAVSQPWQDSKAGIKPVEGGAQPANKPKDSKAAPPDKPAKRTASARTCTSAVPSRFADLMRRLNLAPRCTTRRSAA